MGACCSGGPPVPEGKIKLLLVGAGESGKSTIMKQLGIIFGGQSFEAADLSAPEIAHWRSVIQTNLVEGIQLLSQNIPELEDESLAALLPEIAAWDPSAPLTAEQAGIIETLWADGGMQGAWAARAALPGLPDTLAYFAQHVRRVAGRDFAPTKEDILNTRIRTSGVAEAVIRVDGVPLTVCDAGGQRNERGKWKYVSDEVTALLFVAAINEYDQVLFEDNSARRVDEALKVFEEVCANAIFKQTPIILFLNKSDLFREKLRQVPMRIASGPDARFTDYDGPELDLSGDVPEQGSPEFEAVYDASWRYMRDQFLARNKNSKRLVYPYVTCAMDTDNVRKVFAASKHIILSQNLSSLVLN